MSKVSFETGENGEVDVFDMFDYPFELLDDSEFDDELSSRAWHWEFGQLLLKLHDSDPVVAAIVDPDGGALDPSQLPDGLLDHYIVTATPVLLYTVRSIATFTDRCDRDYWLLGNCKGIVSKLLCELHGPFQRVVDINTLDTCKEIDVTHIEVILECKVTTMRYSIHYYVEPLRNYLWWRERINTDVSYTGSPDGALGFARMVEYTSANIADMASNLQQRLTKPAANQSAAQSVP